MIDKPVIRKLAAALLAVALLYAAASIYMENGYGGIQADVALLKYLLGIDTTGGILQEHVESYLEDRASSISASILLMIASLWIMAKVFVKGKSTD